MRRDKHIKRLTRFMRLTRKRGLHWACKHIDGEVNNGRLAYCRLMGDRISRNAARVGMVGAIMLQTDAGFRKTMEELAS